MDQSELELTAGVPLWAKHPTVTQLTGLSRSKIFALGKEGKIRSVSLREPGQKHASRLFHLESILDYIESFEGKGAAK